jgi:hypothetical protein
LRSETTSYWHDICGRYGHPIVLPLSRATVSNKRPSENQPKIKASNLKGLQNLLAIAKLLERLHKVGTDRDKAKNRDLHMDQYCLLVLLWLYNPILSSMRGLREASNLKEVHKRLGVGRASLGSLSESVSIFDPEPLAALAEELGQKLPNRTPVDFSAIDKRITAVDGSVFKVLSQIAKLAWIPTVNGKHRCGYRLHTQFEVFRGTPSRIDLISAKPKGPSDERVVLEKTLESDHCYLLDRGYEKYALWNAIDAKGSQYVCRILDNPTFQVVENRPLSERAAKENIICDQIVRFGGGTNRPTMRPELSWLRSILWIVANARMRCRPLAVMAFLGS